MNKIYERKYVEVSQSNNTNNSGSLQIIVDQKDKENTLLKIISKMRHIII